MGDSFFLRRRLYRKAAVIKTTATHNAEMFTKVFAVMGTQ